MGWAAAAARVADRIGLVKWLNARVAWDPAPCHRSPGLRVWALILGFLIDPCALYRMEELFEPLDCEVLFGAGVQAHDFTDDAWGRALLKLHAAHPAALFADLSTHVRAVYDLEEAPEVHADTTSLTLQGAYAATNNPIGTDPSPTTALLAPPLTAKPWWGYNKDGHPDCKQLVLGAVTRPDGIPIWVDVNDGNLDDTRWDRQVLIALRESLTRFPDVLFVADSKLINDETVDQMYRESIHFVSRLPNTYTLTTTAKMASAQAPSSNWTPVGRLARRPEGASYRIWETSGVVAGHTHRLVVVESSALRAKAEASITHDRETAAVRLDHAARKFSRQRFASEADAHQAWETWQQSQSALKWWAVQATLITGSRRRRRQGGGPLETVIEWAWVVQRQTVQQAWVEQEHLKRRTFVLIAHDSHRIAEELLAAYNQEWVVEGTHATLKGPLTVAPVFLKDPRKLTAYVYVVYMALLLWHVMQAVARRNALRWGVSLPYPNGQLQEAPSTKRIKELLTPITLIRYRLQNQTHRVLQDLTGVQRLTCLLLEIEPRQLAVVPSG